MAVGTVPRRGGLYRSNSCSPSTPRDRQDFIEDDFNLTGLLQLVPFYKEAMEMILDVEAGAPPPARLACAPDRFGRLTSVT